VVFAPIKLGGISLIDLYTEQSVSQCSILLSHLRFNAYLSDPIQVLLESYQISSGCLNPCLENTTPHPYVHAPWVQSMRQFLQKIDGRILIPDFPRLHKRRTNDSHLMIKSVFSKFKKSELECINACRIYLQVTTLAEITNDTGTHILPEAFYGASDKTNQPKLWHWSQSILKWPYQQKPPKLAWRLWKQYLCCFTKENSTKLQTPLGAWNKFTHTQRTW
jgi:hypothetical protein